VTSRRQIGKGKGKSKGEGLETCYSAIQFVCHTEAQQRLIISAVTADSDWKFGTNELMIDADMSCRFCPILRLIGLCVCIPAVV